MHEVFLLKDFHIYIHSYIYIDIHNKMYISLKNVKILLLKTFNYEILYRTDIITNYYYYCN